MGITIFSSTVMLYGSYVHSDVAGSSLFLAGSSLFLAGSTSFLAGDFSFLAGDFSLLARRQQKRRHPCHGVGTFALSPAKSATLSNVTDMSATCRRHLQLRVLVNMAGRLVDDTTGIDACSSHSSI